MKNLSPVIFFIPFIALILAGIGYIILLKKEINKAKFKKLVFLIFMVAFILNFIWEMLQMPLFKGMPINIQTFAFCALASMADALMGVLIYICFSFIYKKVFWVQQLTFFRIAILVLVGGIGAVLAELRYTALNTWAYNNVMPTIPFINAGIVPVLQFMILPAGIYYLSSRFINNTKTV